MKENTSSVEVQKILYKVGQQSHTLKEPEDSRKLGSNPRQGMGHTGISPGSKHWKCQPVGYQQKYDHKKEDGKSSHWCIFCSAGPQCEDHPLTCRLFPALRHRQQSSHCFQHFLHPPQSPAVFIIRSQCLHDHQLTGSACGFQNAILSSKYSNDWKVWPGFYRLRGNSEFST